MKKVISFVFVMVILSSLFAEDYLDINFFIEPRFEHEKINMINFLIKNIRNDTIQQVNAFAGRLLKEPQSDSLTAILINSLAPEIISPVDYFFYDKTIEGDLLISNIESDSIPIIKNKIIKSDSFSVGIFAIYTPDFTVKNNIAAHAKLETDIFRIAKEQAKYLSKKADYIIMLSNVGKYIDNDIVKDLNVNAVVSFDYQKKRNEKLSNRTTKFYSILTRKGKYGKLRLEYDKGNLTENWSEVEFKY
ncbi:MAG: hypothetical protein HOK80_05635 [Candidatus Cloacimonetes bacterium]|nr:hypothetical protein [Candidatus Cloacimonadota bacterium]MBT4332815.1 hypothetical protein [Candidatus Cloacimonadota bacterium]MBT5420353.1 hypothetical protein [Candidatus Cloacimonadota bacterium]